jgi:ribose transport system permease protein
VVTNTLRNVTSRRFRIPNEFGIFTVLVVVYLILSFQSPYFATYSNMMDLLLNGSVIAFLALGQMLVLLTGGIDLSLGGVIATTGIIAAIVMEHGLPWWIAGVCALACGAIAGAINGILIHYVKIPAFIVTFAMMGVASSIPLILTQGGSVTVNDQTFSLIGQGHILTVPVPVVLVVVAAIVVGVLLKITKFGVHVYAVGGNAAAARLSGVSLARITVTVYSLSGFFAGFGGLIITSRLMIGFPASGLGNELFYSIAAAVVG